MGLDSGSTATVSGTSYTSCSSGQVSGCTWGPPTAYSQTECFDAGITFARAEGIVPAPEANHAVKGALLEAMKCKEEGVSRAILFNLCGHGYFDMQASTDYNAGRLEDHAYDESEVAMALAGLPSVA